MIYQNPTIPEGYYYVKLLNVETKEVGFDFPKIWATLEVLPGQGVLEGTTLLAVIHPTENSVYQAQKFTHTFHKWDDRNYAPELGQVGIVKVYNAEYENMKYSAVKFVYQTDYARIQINEPAEQTENN